MGWKSVRDHYSIAHIVKVVDGDLHIGSPYIGDMVVISPDGTIRTREMRGGPKLEEAQKAIEKDPSTFARLFAQEDAFDVSIPVYTWEDGEIVEKACEELDWPNVTHDGQVMYENQYFTDRDVAVRRARDDAKSGIEGWSRRVAEAERSLEEMKERRDASLAALAKLDRTYPDIAAEDDVEAKDSGDEGAVKSAEAPVDEAAGD
jgi:hypothetical protein